MQYKNGLNGSFKNVTTSTGFHKVLVTSGAPDGQSAPVCEK